MAYCGDGSKLGASIQHSKEEQPLGTAGPLLLVKNLNEIFLVMNGDLLTMINYSNMLKCHRDRNALVTIACYQRDVKINPGVIEMDADNWVTNYIEKPTYHYSMSMGICVFEPDVLEYIHSNQRFNLPELVIRLMNIGQRVNVYNFDGYWLNIGCHDDYERTMDEFASHRNDFLAGEV